MFENQTAQKFLAEFFKTGFCMEEEYSYTQLILAVVKYTRGRYTVDEIRDVLALIEEYEEEDHEAAILSIVKKED